MAKKFWWVISLQIWLAKHGVDYYKGMLKFDSTDKYREASK